MMFRLILAGVPKTSCSSCTVASEVMQRRIVVSQINNYKAKGNSLPFELNIRSVRQMFL